MNIQKKYAWQHELSNLVTDPAELLTLLKLDNRYLPDAIKAAKLFPLKVTRSYIERMQIGNLSDPLLQQVLPLGEELVVKHDYSNDPLEEALVNPIPGLLHKYHGRVLITLTSSCAIHCRFCFRRHFPYADNNPGRAGWEKLFAYIRNDCSIKEVILSGGDPLSVNDVILKQFADVLTTIPHVTTLRFHTRLPIVLPSRITMELCDWLQRLSLQVVVVVHCNHAAEINLDVRAALSLLSAANVHLLNQAVLLKNVNDNIETLVSLSETLFSAGVLPYYLHTLDKVAGAWHFDFPREKAQALHAALIQKLPGYLVPTLVCEEPGKEAKTRL